MAKLAMAIDFLDGYDKLEKRYRNKVKELARTFAGSTATELNAKGGTHLEAYKNAADPRARTVRITDNFRGIVLDAGDNNSFVLVNLGTHDEVDRWMTTRTYSVNAATGALEIVDSAAVQAAVGELEATPAESGPKLFEHRKDKDFTDLGVPKTLIAVLRLLATEDQLQSLLFELPPGQQSALIGLIGDDSIEMLYREVAGDIDSNSIDTDDLAAAIDAPASQAVFHTFTDEEELAQMLNEPFAKWRVYLHHSQRTIAERPIYSGPARVTGGAGTGKTIVAIHRARFLASQIQNNSHPPILFTTFTKNLATSIERQLTSLAGTDITKKVDVTNVDALAHRIVREAEGASPSVLSGSDAHALWDRISIELELDELGFSSEFLSNEWEQVVLAQGIDTRSEYFQASRAGRGVPLSRRARASVWKGIEAFLGELARLNKRTFLQLSAEAAGYLRARSVKPFEHVIVDEGQDLHEMQWRMLRAAVAEGENDMFIVGDTHQRIYDRRSSLSKVGIEVRGRSRKLRINYRTTRQILQWAMALLGEETYDDLDDGTDDQTTSNYHSHLNGERPTTFGGRNAKEQIEALTAQVTSWIEGGLDPDTIGVIARGSHQLEGARAALRAAGVPTVTLAQEAPKDEGVRMGSMHRMKGLEFLAVAVFNVDDDNVPAQIALTDKSADPVQHTHDVRRERCLLYVACTRPRDHLWVGWSGKPSRFLSPVLNA